MENENVFVLLKSRSSQACIREGYHFYTGHFRKIFRYTWPLALVFALLSTVASAMPVLLSPDLLMAGLLLGTLAVILLLWTVRWRLRKRQLIEKVGPIPMKAWMRHLGMPILIWFTCLFIISVLVMLTCLPTIIMMTANWQSQMGVLNGDPSGMPDYVRWMTIIVFLLAGFIQAYVWLTILGPTHLMKGSIVQREKEMKEFNTKKQNNEEKAIVYRP